MSQFCGSLLAFTSRCGVTSAAIAGVAVAARPIDHKAASVVLRGMSSLQVFDTANSRIVALRSRDVDCAVLAFVARTLRSIATLTCGADLAAPASSGPSATMIARARGFPYSSAAMRRPVLRIVWTHWAGYGLGAMC